jgi:hypothetical protein
LERCNLVLQETGLSWLGHYFKENKGHIKKA